MPVTQDFPAPYAPTSAILGIVERHRSRGLPTPISAEVLARAGISDSLIPRTLQALVSLDLVREDGAPTETLEGLRLVSEAQFKAHMINWLNTAYADALAFIDPASADEVDIRDAFRSYKPTGQQDRMVSLFSGLYVAAGVREARERQTAKKLGVRGSKLQSRPTSSKRMPSSQVPILDAVPRPVAGSSLPPALAGLVASLPEEGQGWTQQQRDKFVTTMGVVLDFCYPVLAVDPLQETATDQ